MKLTIIINVILKDFYDPSSLYTYFYNKKFDDTCSIKHKLSSD